MVPEEIELDKKGNQVHVSKDEKHDDFLEAKKMF